MNINIESSLERLAAAHEASASNEKESNRLEGIRLELDRTLQETRGAREALETKASATSTGAATSEWLRQKLAGRDQGPPPSAAVGSDANAATKKKLEEFLAVEEATQQALDQLAERMTRVGRRAPAFYAAVDGAALGVVVAEAAAITPSIVEAAEKLRALVARVLGARELVSAKGDLRLLGELPDSSAIESALATGFPTGGEVAAAASDWRARARELATAPDPESTTAQAAE